MYHHLSVSTQPAFHQRPPGFGSTSTSKELTGPAFDGIRLSTRNQIQGRQIVDNKGLVSSGAVVTANFWQDLSSFFKNMAGGEVKVNQNTIDAALKGALQKLVDHAKKKGANAIVNLRIATPNMTDPKLNLPSINPLEFVTDFVGQIPNGASAILYGDAVKVR